MHRRTVLMTALVPLAQACSRRRGNAPEVPLREMTVAEVAGMIAGNAPLGVYDVNPRARYEQGHVPGARWARVSEISTAILPPDRNTPLVFYCANEH